MDDLGVPWVQQYGPNSKVMRFQNFKIFGIHTPTGFFQVSEMFKWTNQPVMAFGNNLVII